MKKLLVGCSIILLLVVAGCTKKEEVEEKQDSFIYKTEEKVREDWNQIQPYMYGTGLWVISGDIIRTTKVESDTLTRVTVFGIEWVSDTVDADGEMAEDIEDMGHSTLIEKPFVRVIDYNEAESVVNDRRY